MQMWERHYPSPVEQKRASLCGTGFMPNPLYLLSVYNNNSTPIPVPSFPGLSYGAVAIT